MSFEAVYLTLDKADAHRIISSDVDRIRSKTVDTSVEYRNSSGMLLAVLSEVDSDNKRRSKLRYQTSVLTPPLAHGRTKACEIYDAVADYRESR